MHTGDPTEKALLALGHAVLSERKRRHLSQEELAHASGLHRNYVGRLERAEVNPTYDSIVRLALALEMKPSELVTASGW